MSMAHASCSVQMEKNILIASKQLTLTGAPKRQASQTKNMGACFPENV